MLVRKLWLCIITKRNIFTYFIILALNLMKTRAWTKVWPSAATMWSRVTSERNFARQTYWTANWRCQLFRFVCYHVIRLPFMCSLVWICWHKLVLPKTPWNRFSPSKNEWWTRDRCEKKIFHMWIDFKVMSGVKLCKPLY